MFKYIFAPLILAVTLFFAFSCFGLNRDYCDFYVNRDGELRYKDLVYLDDNNDQYDIYGYNYCVKHFAKSYLPYCFERVCSGQHARIQ